MTYSNDLAAADLSDLLDDYYATKALIAAHTERSTAGTTTEADDRQAALDSAWLDALTDEIVKRAEAGQR